MGAITILKNTSVAIDLASDSQDNGWDVSNGYANHSSCNSGVIKNTVFPTVTGQEYTLSYKVLNYSSGQVYMIIGGVNGTSRTADGIYKETLVADDDSGVQFYSDGNLSIGLVKISQGNSPATTIMFNENNNKFVSYVSAQPEYMAKFINSFFMFKDGQLWENNINGTRNNFFGEQFTSKITFYCNLNPTEVKNFYTLREKSNKVWTVAEAKIDPREGKSVGQRSRIKKGNFKSLQGDWFANFLKDLNDPRYTTELDALFNGADLQGNVMEITIENTDTVEVRLLSVDVEVSKQEYTY